MLRIVLLLAICLLPFVFLPMVPAQPPSGKYPRGRSVLMAPNGMVATSQPLAAQAGLTILQQGGSAVDAALAANAVLGLTEPMSCGIGGDLFAIVWDAKTQKLYGLNASGRAPLRATREFFARKGLSEIPLYGALSWSVPGCVDGWAELQKKFGKKSLADVLAPAIDYAEKGFPVTEVIAGSWAGVAERLKKQPETMKIYFPTGKAPQAGEVFRNPALARSYRLLAQEGRDAFYRGAIAQSLAKFSDRVGGLLGAQDLAKHTSTWVEPVSTTYRGHEVWELPPPGQGIAALQILNILEGYDLAKLGAGSADYWHLFLEAKKLAYADRARYYADPEFVKLPTLELISKEYAARRRHLIQPRKAMTDMPAGDPKLGQADTVYLCAVDRDRNCCSLIQSLYHGFGSGLGPAELGFVLQNRGTLFALDPKHLNTLEPGKRPFHTIIPAMVTKNGRPWLTFGVMGGDMQAQGHAQVLCNLIDFGMNVQQAGEFPRIEHVGSATPTGKPADPKGGVAKVEPGIPEAVVEELRWRGHIIERVQRNGGGYQAILIDPQTGMLQGGSEPRKDGCAVGY